MAGESVQALGEVRTWMSRDGPTVSNLDVCQPRDSMYASFTRAGIHYLCTCTSGLEKRSMAGLTRVVSAHLYARNQKVAQ